MLTEKRERSTKIFPDEDGSVWMEHKTHDGELAVRTFTCPVNGGPVMEDGMIVCRNLGTAGEPLESPSQDALLNVIRREHKRARRATGLPLGRPKKRKVDVSSCSFVLSDRMLAIATAAGDGNMTEGIRVALTEWLDAKPGRRPMVRAALGE